MKKYNNTEIVCPVCGTKMQLGEHEHTVQNATVIGKDSGLGTIYLKPEEDGVKPAAPVNKAEARLAALKAAGVNTDNLFAVKGASGEGVLIRMDGGAPAVVADDDPIFKAIVVGGTIPERRLFRRWVAGQMSAMLTYKGKRGYVLGFTEALKAKGYNYQFSMLLDELNVQAKLAQRDKENFLERNHWFTKDVVVALVDYDIECLKAHIDSLETRKCKGLPYVRFNGKNIFRLDVDSKVLQPLRNKIIAIVRTKNIHELAEAYARYYKARYARLPWNTKQCKEWVDAYKGAGAFYTMKNFILFHGCVITDEYGITLNKYQSMEYLKSKNDEYKGEGWRMLGVLKKMLNDNHIDLEAKRAEWRAAKLNK